MPDIRTIARDALTDLLRWNIRRAVTFVEVLTAGELADIEEHVRESSTPIVGVAAVVYRVRLRLAGSDREAKQRARVEAGEHYRLLKYVRLSSLTGQAEGQAGKPDVQHTRIHRVAESHYGRRRREDDTR